MFPLLEEFGIAGYLHDFSIGGGDDQRDKNVAPSFLRFDLSHLKHLKSIKVKVSRPSYYKWNVSGKRDCHWLDLDTPRGLESDDNNNKKSNRREFYIDRAWSPENTPSVTLWKVGSDVRSVYENYL